MIDIALSFLAKSLDTYLKARSAVGDAVVSRLVDGTGKWAIAENKLGVSLLNVEEERVLKTHLPETTYVNGRHVVLEPPLKLNLSIAIAANFKAHDEAWRHISLALTYFQAVSTFSPEKHPDLDPRIEQLNLELLSLSFEQLNQIWAFVGGKQLPSVFYKVRLLTLQDEQALGIGAPITSIDTRLQGR
jgi:hypothetical protein